MSFSFGAPAPTAAGGGGGFSFGGGSGSNAPAPSAGGGLFGSSTTPASAPAASNSNTMNASGGGLFGNTPAPAPGGGGLFGASSSSNSTPPPTTKVPAYETLFPYTHIYDKLKKALREEELPDFVQQHASALWGDASQLLLPPPPSSASNLLQQWQTNPRVSLEDMDGAIATLTPSMIQAVAHTADACRIPEPHALSLLRRATTQGLPVQASTLIQLFFNERQCGLQCIMLLLQQHLSEVTDFSLDAATIAPLTTALFQVVRLTTVQLQKLMSLPDASRPEVQRHVQYYVSQRQRAAAAVYLLHYSSPAPDLNALLLLVQELSNELHQILPTDHVVPSPLHYDAEKDRLAWQTEWVTQVQRTLQPALLRTVSILMCAVISASQGHHGPVLLPADLQAPQWKRRDILGVLRLARACAEPDSTSWRQEVQEGAENRAFTFLRCSLLPVLDVPSRPSEAVQLYQFLYDTVAELTSQTLDLISRDGLESRLQWEQDQQALLETEQLQKQQQRSFERQHGIASERDTTPTKVNILDRPDCMDDVVALCVAVCNKGAECARYFWKQEDGGVLAPSASLLKLEQLVERDLSLRASYSSFLAGLALARGGAAAVHRLLADDRDHSLAKPARSSWSMILRALNWYVGQLNDTGSSSSSSATIAATTTPGKESTAYYYFNDNPQAAITSTQRKESTSSVTKGKELGEDNEYIVLGYLALITNAALGSPEARLAILACQYLGSGSQGSTIIADGSSMALLFALLTSPLSPRVRGAVSSCLAALLSADGFSGASTLEKMNQFGLQAWNYLETSQIVPIFMLDQYPSVRDADLANFPGISFPPASKSLWSKKLNESWCPADKDYGIICEMEHVEAKSGEYPSTEGLLKLLKSLISTSGCPTGLGKNWRSRPGCTPYLEYVANLILPRATGHFEGQPALMFRSEEDRYRLHALALDVCAASLCRYTPPCLLGNTAVFTEECVAFAWSEGRDAAIESLHVDVLRESVVTKPHVKEALSFVRDFGSIAATAVHKQTARDQLLSPSANGSTQSPVDLWVDDDQISLSNANIPPLKSPGFSLLVEVLSAAGGSLFACIHHMLTRATQEDPCVASDAFVSSTAMFGTLHPVFETSIRNARRRLNEVDIAPLRPTLPEPSFHGTLKWKETTERLALRILCAALAREHSMEKAAVTFGRPSSVVPALHFQKRNSTRPSVLQQEVRLEPLSKLLGKLREAKSLFSKLVSLVGDRFSSETTAAETAASALATLLQWNEAIQPIGGIAGLIQNDTALMDQTSAAFSSLILSNDFPSIRVLLSRIADDFRSGAPLQNSLALALLGQSPCLRRQDLVLDNPRDCCEALVKLVLNEHMYRSEEGSSLVSLGLEILVSLCRASSFDSFRMEISIVASERLHKGYFWKTAIFKTIVALAGNKMSRLGRVNMIHAVAFALSGCSNELFRLGGYHSLPDELGRISFRVSPKQTEFADFREFVLCECVPRALGFMPTRAPLDQSGGAKLSRDDIRKVIREIRGPKTIVEGYEVIDVGVLRELVTRKQVGVNTLHSDVAALSETELLAWVEQWNIRVETACAATHLSDVLHHCISSALGLGGSSVADLANDGVHAQGIFDLLLNVMQFHDKPNETVLITAGRNLARCVLAASRQYAAHGQIVDLASSFAVLARAIAQSGSNIGIGVDADRMNERSVTLALALENLLRKGRLSDIHENDHYDMANCATVLAKLASQVDLSDKFARPTMIAMSARSCLSALLGAFDNHEDDRSRSFVQSILVDRSPVESSSDTVIGRLLQSVALFDSDICDLLQKIAQMQYGADILLENRVLDYLDAAARNYKEEENEALSTSEEDLSTPGFIVGHADLLGLLMTADGFSQNRRDRLDQAWHILSLYESTFDRLVHRFPLDGDCLFALLRALAVAKSLGPTLPASISDGATQQKHQQFDATIMNLILRLLDYPLPPAVLNVPPTMLDGKQVQSDALRLIRPRVKDDHLWWEQLDLKIAPKSSSSAWLSSRATSMLSVEVLEYATLGASLLHTALCAVGDNSLDSSWDMKALCRGLCQCTEALNIVSMSQSSSIYEDDAAKEQKRLLCANLGDIIVDLLVLVCSHVRRLNRDADVTRVRPRPELYEIVNFMLDKTNLDQKGVSMELGGDENQRDLAFELANTLRQQLA